MPFDNCPPLIVIATRNEGKLREFKQLLHDLPTTIVGLDHFPHVTVSEEPYSTYIENAEQKALNVMQQLHLPVLADDSGIEIFALPAVLGVHSARYQPELSYPEKCRFLISLLEDKDRSARFVAAIALVIPNRQSIVVEGECRGTIASHLQGTNGFGYDPIFIPHGYIDTYAQMSETLKNSLSHRAHAVQKLLAVLGEPHL